MTIHDSWKDTLEELFANTFNTYVTIHTKNNIRIFLLVQVYDFF